MCASAEQCPLHPVSDHSAAEFVCPLCANDVISCNAKDSGYFAVSDGPIYAANSLRNRTATRRRDWKAITDMFSSCVSARDSDIASLNYALGS